MKSSRPQRATLARLTGFAAVSKSRGQSLFLAPHPSRTLSFNSPSRPFSRGILRISFMTNAKFALFCTLQGSSLQQEDTLQVCPFSPPHGFLVNVYLPRSLEAKVSLGRLSTQLGFWSLPLTIVRTYFASIEIKGKISGDSLRGFSICLICC